MFLHTVTVVNISENNNVLTFSNCIVNDVFFYSTKIISQEGKGENYSNTYNCIFSNESLKKYLKSSEYSMEEDTFTLIKNKTIIVKGETNINDLEDLDKIDDWFYVKTISDNSDYGAEDLRNIEVTN